MDRHIKAPFDREEVKALKAGDYVYIDGIVYSAGMPHTRECMMPSWNQDAWTPVELSYTRRA